MTSKNVRNNTLTGADVRNSSLTGADVRGSSLTSSDVRDRSLLARDFRSGQLPRGATGAQGPAGPKGDAGPTGPQGPPGPTTAYHAVSGGPTELLTVYSPVETLTLPAGSYVVSATAEVEGTSGVGDCELNAFERRRGLFDIRSSGDVERFVGQTTVTLTGPQTVYVLCREQAGSLTMGSRSLVALRVGSVVEE